MFVPVTAAVMGTAFLLNRKDAWNKGVIPIGSNEEKLTTNAPKALLKESQPGASFTSDYGQDTSLPTYTSTTIPTHLTPLPQVLSGRDSALEGASGVALPNADSNIKGSHRTQYIRTRQSVINPFTPEIGDSRHNFRAIDIPNQSYYERLPINRKDFMDAAGNIPGGYSTGQIAGEPGTQKEAMLSRQGLTRDPRFGQMPHQVRKTDPIPKSMGIQPNIRAYVPGINQTQVSCKRKNVISTWFPARRSVYSMPRMDPDAMINVDKDRTIMGRQPYLKGIGQSTRPAIADMNISMKEDHTLPGRQPGPAAGIVRKPFIKFGDMNDSRKVKAEWSPEDDYASYRGRAFSGSMQSRLQGPRQGVKDSNIWSEKQGMEHGRTTITGIKAMTSDAIGENTRSGKMEPPMPHHDIFNDSYIDKVTKHQYRTLDMKNGIMQPMTGLHATSNPDTDKRPFYDMSKVTWV
jgi:hypothetical protein